MSDILNFILNEKYLFAISVTVFLLVLTATRLLMKRFSFKTEIDDLVDLSRKLRCSEFDIFQQAGKRWNFSVGKIKSDFKRYPYYR